MSSPVLVGIRDTEVTETASDGPEWLGRESGSTIPNPEDGKVEMRGGFPEEGPCELSPKG